jgi:hypothetical protein
MLVFYKYLKNYKNCEIIDSAIRFSDKFSFEWSTSQLAQTPSCDFLKMKTPKYGLVESWTQKLITEVTGLIKVTMAL